jgi:tmRNA-binding protein
MCGIKQHKMEMNEINCDCGGVRKLLTKKEKIEKLKQYQENLEQELVAVRETLQSLTQNN